MNTYEYTVTIKAGTAEEAEALLPAESKTVSHMLMRVTEPLKGGRRTQATQNFIPDPETAAKMEASDRERNERRERELVALQAGRLSQKESDAMLRQHVADGILPPDVLRYLK